MTTNLHAVYEGVVYHCDFSRNDFSATNGKHEVVVLVEEHSVDKGKVRALVVRAEKNGKSYTANVDEVFTVPVEKLVAVYPRMTEQDLRNARNELKRRIP
ncbi:hypothetical protein ACFFQW_45880 [Umezawaea endophytica]|uniref:Uncharacterized protein n=1 Tax=Umezawaea endophytica TaxID=1654476 RepID=A0A9X3AIN0_9PSEU|nr:hypothetical protein [Umezawaea endophytica]MCS7483317.1 hypothetical protein [Umezawaea endophytica]